MLKEASAKEPHYIGLLSEHHIIAPLPSHLRTEGESVKMQVASSESILKPARKLALSNTTFSLSFEFDYRFLFLLIIGS